MDNARLIAEEPLGIISKEVEECVATNLKDNGQGLLQLNDEKVFPVLGDQRSVCFSNNSSQVQQVSYL